MFPKTFCFLEKAWRVSLQCNWQNVFVFVHKWCQVAKLPSAWEQFICAEFNQEINWYTNVLLVSHKTLKCTVGQS